MPPSQETLGFMLVDVSRLLRRAFKQRLTGSSLTHAQARALVYIARNEGIRQVDLAELLEVQPITLVRLIDQLAGARLVERRADPRDRRAYQLYLTAKAAPQLAAIDRVAKTIRAAAMAGLTEKQSTAVMSALRTMRRNLVGP